MNDRLRSFVVALSELTADAAAASESWTLSRIEPLMRDLLAHDDWLPDEFAQRHPQYYQQYLLYGDPRERFSVVSFVWGPGQRTPIHDHTVWGVVGVLRGAEYGQRYRVGAHGLQAVGDEERLLPGDVALVSPTLGDIHRVRNALDDAVSISVHVYGGNIGRVRRHVFDEASGATREFVSGYANAFTPNLWCAPPR